MIKKWLIGLACYALFNTHSMVCVEDQLKSLQLDLENFSSAVQLGKFESVLAVIGQTS